jgi:hypothetical protein
VHLLCELIVLIAYVLGKLVPNMKVHFTLIVQLLQLKDIAIQGGQIVVQFKEIATQEGSHCNFLCLLYMILSSIGL